MSGTSPEVDMAREHGFDIWQIGGGLTAFGRVAHESENGDQVVVMITPGESGVGHVGDPTQSIWSAGVDATTKSGGESLSFADGMTLDEAIDKAREFEAVVMKSLGLGSVDDLIQPVEPDLPAVSGFGM